jgi:hypothetical protein
MDVYFNSGIGDVVVIPDHQCEADLKLLSRDQTIRLEDVKVLSKESGQWPRPISTAPAYQHSPVRHTIQRGVNQIIIEGPGPAQIVAYLNNDDTSTVDLTDVRTISVDIKLTPVDASIPISLTTELSWFAGRNERTMSGPKIAEWEYRPAQGSI